MAFKVIEYRQLIQILAMFMIVQFFGLLLATVSLSGATLQAVQSAALFSSYTSLLFYIAYIVAFSLILILLFRMFSTDKLFRVLEAFVVFVSSFIVFATLLSLIPYPGIQYLQGLPFGIDAIAAAVLAAALVAAKNKWQRLRNAAAMISAAGVGLLFGLTFTFWIALLFMALLAVYDFVAVFITKHMLSLAKIAETNNLALLIGVDEVEGLPSRAVRREVAAAYRKDKTARKRFAPIIGERLVPVAARIELGTGDLAMPLMVSVSAAASTFSLMLSLFMVMGSIFGLLLTMFILRRFKRALPAIPPLLLGILVFLGLYFLIF